MTRTPVRLAAVAAAMLVTAAVGVGLTAPGANAGPSAPTAVLPTAPAGTVSVLEDNISDMLNADDVTDTRDLQHLAYRVRSVLTALNARGPAVPNYAPDVVLLSESNAASAKTVAAELTSYLGYDYKVGVSAETGTGAYAKDEHGQPIKQTSTHAAVLRDTSILYNADTMNTPTTMQIQEFTYPHSEVPAGSTKAWESLRQSLVLATKKAGGAQYAFASLHYQPNDRIRDFDAYKGGWTQVLKDKLQTAYPNVPVIAGGDLNMTRCYSTTADYGYSNCTAGESQTPAQMWTAFTSYHRPYHPAFDLAVDHVFTTGTVLAAGEDTDYKNYSNPGPTYFHSKTQFTNCANYYDRSWRNDTEKAAAMAEGKVEACQARYYSDHDFHWATVR